jgi:polysaccharide chain length determinant protein (PEP-CTERM system associated)
VNERRLPGPPGSRRPQGPDLLAEVPVVLAEFRRRGLMLAIAFALIALMVLGVGMVWPKRYVANATIVVGESNIIEPLMRGTAVPTEVTDRARIAREVIFSNRVMADVVDAGGWDAQSLDPISRERLFNEVRRRTDIGVPGPNLIRLSYSDSDPERAFRVADHFVDKFVSQSQEAKMAESREAYEFIAKQVDQYHTKLIASEERLKQLRDDNLDARPGAEVDVSRRIAEIRRTLEDSQTNVAELQSRRRALLSQISGEARVSDERMRSSQVSNRLRELQAELDRLRLDYTEMHPDVIRTRNQIEEVQSGGRRDTAQASTGFGSVDPTINPLYQQLRAELARVDSDLASQYARVAQTQTQLDSEMGRARRVSDSDITLAELTRDYEVNRELYQDLLRRRENARVSMNLDEEHKGLNLWVQEPPTVPLTPEGLRLAHFAVAGVFLGFAIPIGMLITVLRLDPRSRLAGQLGAATGLPVLVGIPEYRTRQDRRRIRGRQLAAIAAVLVVFAIYAVVALTR